MATDVDLRWLTSPAAVDDALLDALISCWRRVSNAGGAVGFPFLPVAEEDVRVAAIDMRASLSERQRLLVVTIDDTLAGWLLLRLNTSPLTSHWAVVTRVQTDLPHRNVGLGRRLMDEVERAARDDLNLEQLHIELRDGLGLEEFYSRLGWRAVGRWPRALRLKDGDDRDEVLMILPLSRM